MSGRQSMKSTIREKEAKNNFKILFDTYEEFLAALVDMLTENDDPQYAEYQEQCENDENVDQKYINYYLENGLDPQIGLIKMIKAVIAGHRNSTDPEILRAVISPFIISGANLKLITPYLFNFRSFKNYDDIAYHWGEILVAATILDLWFNKFDLDYISNVCDWKNIEPKHWQDEYEEIVDSDFPRIIYEMYKEYCDNLKKL
jgi:hypothetical protein